MSTTRTVDLKAALRQLESWQCDQPAAVKRMFRRFPVRGEARLTPGESVSDSSASPLAQIRDISRGGFGILSSQPASPGQFWQVQVVEGTVVLATVPAFCRYCRQIIDGAYLIGAAFGVDASLMLAMGVPTKELAHGDQPEGSTPLDGSFLEPESILADHAA